MTTRKQPTLPGIYAHTITGKVIEVIRRGHTYVGNPKMSLVMQLHTIEGTPVEGDIKATIRIRDNSGMVYAIENREFRENVYQYSIDKRGSIYTYEGVNHD